MNFIVLVPRLFLYFLGINSKDKKLNQTALRKRLVIGLEKNKRFNINKPNFKPKN